MIIHLLNNPLPFIPRDTLSADQLKYFYIDEMIPVHDIVIKLNDFEVKSAYRPFCNESFEVTKDQSEIVVLKMDIQEVVLLKLAK